MCNTNLKKEIEFCENFRATVVGNILYPMIRFVTNTKRELNTSCSVFTSMTTMELEKILKSNKVLVLSHKVYTLLGEICGYDNVKQTTILNKNIGGIYVEYFQNTFWITNYKGFRVSLRLGKLLKAITDLNDKEISNFVDKYNRYITYDISPIQVTSDISSIYDMEHSGNGSVGGSCMRGYGEFFESLQESAEDLQIAYLIDDNSDELIGRALLWVAYDSSNDKSYKIMDRIYYDCERTKVLFEKYAETNGYYFRKESSGSCTVFYDTKKKSWVELDLYVKLNSSLMGTETPYMDTFRFYEGHTRIQNSGSCTYRLTSTEGDVLCSVCDCCGDNVDPDDIIYSAYHNSRICYNCLEDYRYVEHLSDHIHEDYCIQIRDTHTYIHENYLDRQGVVYVEDMCWYDYADDVYYTEDTGEYYACSYSLYEYDGVYYKEQQELEEKEEER